MNKIKLMISLAICFAAEGLGGLFTAQSVGAWYLTLQKPAFTPPGWLFGPVWTLLYLMMGIALYLIWKRAGSGAEVRGAVTLFAFQLLLNVAWSGVFFGWQSPLGGLLILVALWLTLVLTVWRFRQISRLAAGLLLPYLAWTSFAAVLNFAIWRLNS